MIDMDDLLGDDDFFQDMTVYRRTIRYDESGAAEWRPILITPTPTASIQSGANPELLRLPDMATSANMITVYTAFRLLCEGDSFGTAQGPEALARTDLYGNQVGPRVVQSKADIVMYHGDPYEIFLVQDWTDFGAGFIAALGRMISSAQTGPDAG